MGSMLKFDSDRRDLVRERRDARIERKQQRRQARERNTHVDGCNAVRPRRCIGSRNGRCRQRSTRSSTTRSTATSRQRP